MQVSMRRQILQHQPQLDKSHSACKECTKRFSMACIPISKSFIPKSHKVNNPIFVVEEAEEWAHTGHEVDGHAVKVLLGAVGQGVEGLRGDPRVGNAAQQPREEVGRVDLAQVAGVRQDHAAAEDLDGNTPALVQLLKKHLHRPLAAAVPAWHIVCMSAVTVSAMILCEILECISAVPSHF